MRTEQELKNWVERERYLLAEVKKKKKCDYSIGSIIEVERELAKALFNLGRFYHNNGSYGEVIALITEAHEFVGPSTESKYYLADSLVKTDKWEEAYELLRKAKHQTGFTQWKHPMYDDPEVIVDDLNKLFPLCMDHCSRLQQPVTNEEFNNWHWNKRFKDCSELEMVVSRYHPIYSQIQVRHHPFDFKRFERINSFDGLTDKGVPFQIENKKGILTLDQLIKVTAGDFVVQPNSNLGHYEDWAGWLEVDLYQ